MKTASAKVDITPKSPMPMAGYALRKGKSEGILDPLYARILYIEDESPVIMISLDLIRVDNELYEEISGGISNEIGIPKRNILVAATHTHSGPEISTGFWSSIELSESDIRSIEEYRQHLIDSILSAVNKLKIKETSLFGGKAEVNGVASNRLSRDGPMDNECVFLFSEREFVSLNFPCHPTVLPASNRKFSGDLAGAICRLFERSFNVALFLNGAAGNVSTRFTRKAQTYEEVKRLAKLFYSHVKDNYSEIEKIEGQIKLKWKNIDLKVKELPPIEELEKFEEELYKKLAESKIKNISPAELRILESNYLGVKILKRRAELLKNLNKITLRIAKLEIGDKLAAVFVPAELFVEYQLELKKNSPYKYTMVVCYANGYVGYIPFSPVEGIYESYASIVAPSEYRHLRKELLRLLTE
ncbi:neutral/alkaline non-lysosomal ceramidase N-terminal domain-containing protein [Thermococcus barophilus]|uniref:Neutral/alkaline non-lysosomal ceramidase N-terminal domain-containing protein n=1 Tax=Thermococcus barophilus TaxID=55802 RepID=A0A0S1X9S1_THEBA|nr:neutral/alkaline non-lysosomal ceramidase N-terminal domain-containing protein [Thermococcus barophilus]ALM74491.1 hypothetical protein TBCH5v1_0523 [Thermococcus barophilus]